MDALALEPTLVAAETTEQRFVMRVRLAGDDQLGSHTPRPQAPADSLASVQVHETAMNNVLAAAGTGRPDLHAARVGPAHRPAAQPPLPAQTNPDHEDVTITFASHDAVRVRCVDGRIEITLSIAKLAKPPRKWKDFQVRAYYRPEVHGRSVEFARDGVIQLIGRVNAGRPDRPARRVLKDLREEGPVERGAREVRQRSPTGRTWRSRSSPSTTAGWESPWDRSGRRCTRRRCGGEGRGQGPEGRGQRAEGEWGVEWGVGSGEWGDGAAMVLPGRFATIIARHGPSRS